MPKTNEHRRGVIPKRSELNAILRELSNRSATDGVRITRDWAGGTRTHLDDSSIGFSGTAYVAGKKNENLNEDDTKPWIKCDLGTKIATEETGPPFDPFPDNEEWFEKAFTAGDIHVSRA